MTESVDIQRRSFLLGAAATMAAAATARAMGAPAAEGAKAAAAVPDAAPVLKPLAFDPAKLAGISEKLIRSHWENNYGSTVKALGVVKKRLAEAMADKDLPPYIYNDLKRDHLVRTGSVVLHERYFDNLGGDGKAGAAERKTISDAFGSFDAWETEFRRIGVGLGGGSGWVVLGHNLHTGRLENYWMADHAHGAMATVPVLVMDMYEHAYQMDYGAAAAKYVDAFFHNIQWDAVAARLSALPKA